MIENILYFGLNVSKGFALGCTIYALGGFMDSWFSSKSVKALLESKNHFLHKADNQVLFNLAVISPVVYSVASSTFLQNHFSFSTTQYMFLLFLQNSGYYIAHALMHQHAWLYKYHRFHHEFDTITIPSSGNAVTSQEFVIAYIAPFVVGGIIVRPTEFTYVAAIGTIAVLNMVIHTAEWQNVQWVPWLISPAKHVDHHKKRFTHYSAPLLDFDYLFDSVFSLFSQKIEKQD